MFDLFQDVVFKTQHSSFVPGGEGGEGALFNFLLDVGDLQKSHQLLAVHPLIPFVFNFLDDWLLEGDLFEEMAQQFLLHFLEVLGLLVVQLLVDLVVEVANGLSVGLDLLNELQSDGIELLLHCLHRNQNAIVVGLVGLLAVLLADGSQLLATPVSLESRNSVDTLSCFPFLHGGNPNYLLYSTPEKTCGLFVSPISNEAGHRQNGVLVIIIIVMENYRIEGKKGEGTYSEVFTATSRLDGQRYALKVMKQRYLNLEKIKKDKEIKALKSLSHPHIVKLMDVLYSPQEEKMALVFELMDCNLYELYKHKKTLFNLDRIRSICHDLLEATAFIHQKGIFHRDIKPENILVKGDRDIKLADFGSCKNMHSSPPYTEYISTRWYRAPECLLTDGHYSEKMDLWSIGCILFELYTQYPLFPGKNELDQASTIFSILGSPSVALMYEFTKRSSRQDYHFQPTAGIGLKTLIPDAPEQFLDLLSKLLQLDPSKRMDAEEALNHQFFYSLTELKKYRKSLISRISEGKDISLPLLKSKKF